MSDPHIYTNKVDNLFSYFIDTSPAPVNTRRELATAPSNYPNYAITKKTALSTTVDKPITSTHRS